MFIIEDGIDLPFFAKYPCGMANRTLAKILQFVFKWSDERFRSAQYRHHGLQTASFR